MYNNNLTDMILILVNGWIDVSSAEEFDALFEE